MNAATIIWISIGLFALIEDTQAVGIRVFFDRTKDAIKIDTLVKILTTMKFIPENGKSVLEAVKAMDKNGDGCVDLTELNSNGPMVSFIVTNSKPVTIDQFFNTVKDVIKQETLVDILKTNGYLGGDAAAIKNAVGKLDTDKNGIDFDELEKNDEKMRYFIQVNIV